MGRNLTAILLAACFLLPGCTTGQEEPAFNGSEFAEGTWAPIFTLEDSTGELWSLEEQRGKVVVLSFVYTRCSVTCPVVTASLDVVHDRLDAETAANTVFVSVTIDPYHDSPAVLEDYRTTRGFEWTFLTGVDTAVNPVLDIYEVDPIDYADDSDEQGYQFYHTQPTLIIDHLGYKRVVHSDETLHVDLFQQDLEQVVSEMAQDDS